MLHKAVHARDADGREQAADGGRDQADEQRDQHKDGLLRAGVDRERLQRDHREQEDDREAGEQDVEGDLVRRLLPFGAFDQRDHAVEEGLAGVRRDADGDDVRQHACAAGHGRAVAAGLANDRSRLARDGGFIDRRDALDDLAVPRDHLPRDDADDVVRAELRAGNLFDCAVLAHDVRRGLGFGAAQCVGLRLAAAFGHGFGEVGEQHREPQPQGDLQVEAEVALVAQVIGKEQHGGEHAADFHDEHDGVLHHRRGLQLDERIDACTPHDLRVEQGAAVLVAGD